MRTDLCGAKPAKRAFSQSVPVQKDPVPLFSLKAFLRLNDLLSTPVSVAETIKAGAKILNNQQADVHAHRVKWFSNENAEKLQVSAGYRDVYNQLK